MAKFKLHRSVTAERVEDAVRRQMCTLDNPGICVVCGEDHYECEPDACNYPCDSCEEEMVFGASELLMRGWYWTEAKIARRGWRDLCDWIMLEAKYQQAIIAIPGLTRDQYLAWVSQNMDNMRKVSE